MLRNDEKDYLNPSKPTPEEWYSIQSICCPGEFVAKAIQEKAINRYKIKRLVELFPKVWEDQKSRMDVSNQSSFCVHTKEYCLNKAFESKDKGKIDVMLSLPDLKRPKSKTFKILGTFLKSKKRSKEIKS